MQSAISAFTDIIRQIVTITMKIIYRYMFFIFLIIILINYSKIECLGHIIANGIQILLYFIQNVQSKESFDILDLGLLPEFEVLRDYTTG